MNKKLQMALFAVPILVGVYLIYRQVRGPKREKYEAPDDVVDGLTDPISGGGGGSTRNDEFPLRKGSYGPNVKRLQKAMLGIKPDALPKYGADSDFGSETEMALQYLSGSKTCTESQLKDLEQRAESVRRGQQLLNQGMASTSSMNQSMGPVYNSGVFF